MYLCVYVIYKQKYNKIALGNQLFSVYIDLCYPAYVGFDAV